MKKLTFFLFSFFFTVSLLAQSETAVWSFQSEKLTDNEYNLVFSAQIAPKYHVYSMNNVAEDGPRALKIIYDEGTGYELMGKLEIRSKEEEEADPQFGGMKVKYFSSIVTIVQKVKLTGGGTITIKGIIEYQTCGENQCAMNETEFSFTLTGTGSAVAATPQTGNVDKGADQSLASDNSQVSSPGSKKESRSLLVFFFIAFAAGLGGILTPCVFPMIPMTISFFMMGSDKRIVGIIKGIVFGLSVTLIYTMIGVVVAITSNATLADILSNNWISALIFFLLFVAFAVSFFGVYEITLPSSLANRADRQADKGGYVASFFLAVVLALVSFSCTGPFVGAILVEAAQGGVAMKPIVGMFGFGLALSLPFVVMAIFPSLLKKLPKSGGWLNAVKIFFAFMMLAFGMKFLIVVDAQLKLNIITRDVFIAIWIVLFTLLGMYLLGKIKFSHDSEVTHIGFFRLLLAIITFTFVVYLIPGLFGAPLAAVSGLMPPQEKQVFDLTRQQATPLMPTISINTANTESQSNILCSTPKYAGMLHLPVGIQGYFDLKEGLACAKEQGKPILLDFKGHGCANCKKMDKEVFADPRVIDFINKHFIIIGLYVDDDTELPQSEWITGADGREKKTIGKVNREYQMTKYGQASQPYFIIVDNNEKPLVEGVGYESSPDKFLEWLQKAEQAYKNAK